MFIQMRKYKKLRKDILNIHNILLEMKTIIKKELNVDPFPSFKRFSTWHEEEKEKPDVNDMELL